MCMTTSYIRFGLLTLFIPLLCVSFASAQETSVDVSAEASVQTSPPPPGPRPLQQFREQKQQIIQETRDNKRELRRDTVQDLKAAMPGAGERRDVVKQFKEDRGAIMENRREDMQDLRQKMKEKVRQHAGLIRERFSNAIRHLNQIMARVETRIEKMKSSGVDVSSVESLQIKAEVAIDTAESDIAAVRTYIESVTDTSDRSVVRTELQAKVTTARESIRAAHTAVRAVVKSLVDLSKSIKPSATIEAEASVTVE